MFKSGFVSIIGRPNVGKSTLMNSLVGAKLAITSNKPQTTRNRILSVLTEENSQIVFIDTPGIMQKANNKLGKYMQRSTKTTFKEVDMVLFLVEPDLTVGAGDKAIIESLKKVKTPIFLVVNKIDKITTNELLAVIDTYRKQFEFNEVIPVSAINGDNTGELIKTIKSYLPEGPRYFPDDMITDRPEKWLVSELIREKALRNLEEEIPHGVAVEIVTMKKREEGDIVEIDANIYCERESHKGIIIGKNGDKLKRISTHAREDIESLLGSKIFLQVWVKVKKNWRDSDFLLKNLGYNSKLES